MSRRILPSVGDGLAVLSMMLVAVASVAGQAPAARKSAPAPKNAASKWTAPRTAWGDPDLQGTWNNGTITPLERPRAAGEKELLSKEEEAEVNEQSDTRAERRPADKAQDVELAYDQFWWDRGASIGRTSPHNFSPAATWRSRLSRSTGQSHRQPGWISLRQLAQRYRPPSW